jgi:hypothetical protein
VGPRQGVTTVSLPARLVRHARPGTEDQPDLALEGGIHHLLATPVRPARTRLTATPSPATGKATNPAQPEPVPAPGTPGATATRREHTNRTPPPKTGTTRSVTDLAPPLNR